MNTPRLASLALLASLPGLIAGCGALDGQDDAGRGMEALMKVLGGGTPSALTAAVEDGRATSFREFGVDISGAVAIDSDVDCPEGGKMKLEGQLELTSQVGDLDGWDAFGSVGLEFDMNVKFKRCKIDGVKLGGDLRYALDIEADSATGSASLEWSYTGEVKFRGDIKGSCEVDMSASASSGDAFGNLEIRAYGGTMCGFEAEEVSGYADLSFEL